MTKKYIYNYDVGSKVSSELQSRGGGGRGEPGGGEGGGGRRRGGMVTWKIRQQQ